MTYIPDRKMPLVDNTVSHRNQDLGKFDKHLACMNLLPDRRSCLTLIPPNKLSSAKFLVCFNFQGDSMMLKVDEILSEWQTALIRIRRRVTAWIRMRRRVTRRLIRVQAVCIWHISCDWRPKGQLPLARPNSSRLPLRACIIRTLNDVSQYDGNRLVTTI